jgi:hypothetical protein
MPVPWRTHGVALAGYALVSVLFTWPLVLYLDSRLPGGPSGDTGVYVWNIWVFRHEILRGHFPLYTNTIFSLDQTANLSLHNYTLFADILAYPLLPLLGVVRTFNVLHIGLFVLNAWAMFALARHVTGRSSVAWLAGLLFGFSPTLVARSTAHASLLAAAPLPLFVLCMMRLNGPAIRRWSMAAGLVLAWAALCDPYYAVYCILLAGWHLGSRVFRLTIDRPGGAWTATPARVLEGAALLLLAVVAVIVVSGGFSVRVAGLDVGLRTIYTPVLLATACAAALLLVAWRPHLEIRPSADWLGLLRAAPYGALAATAVLSPVLHALIVRILDGRYVAPKVFWRTSTPGVDLLSLVGPNPNLSWLGSWRRWLTVQSGGFEENVASVTFTALAVLALAFASARFRPARYWVGLAALAGAVTLGPFVHVAGANTCIPTPWTLLRYAPVVGVARAPARFAVLVMLALAVLFALALRALAERYPAKRRLVLGAAAAALLFELFPAPRPLYSARVPAIYDRIAADPSHVRVLELPFGVRDGLSSYGNRSAATQFFQTRHEKGLIGGYLSRVSHKRVAAIRRRPILAALMTLSEGGTIAEGEDERLAGIAPSFVERSRLGYVVIDRGRASDTLAAFAVRVLSLEKIGQDGPYELYRPRSAAAAQAGSY